MENNNTLSRRRFSQGLLASAVGASFAPQLAWAQAGGQAQFLVPFTPGTTPDLLARLLSAGLAKSMNKNFVTENRPGASGMIGLQAVLRGAPDGSMLTVNTNTALTLPFVYKTVPFDVLNDFTPVAMLGVTNFALCVNANLGVKTLQEFIDLAKKRGGDITYASPGKGTLHHLCMEMLMDKTGIQLSHVPYKGSAQATTDLVGGHVNAMFQPMHVAEVHAKAGRIVILGATRKEQDPTYPNVKPLAQLGVKDYEADSWYAVWGPSNMPADVVATLNKHINDLLQNDATVKETLSKQGVVPEPMSPEQLFAKAKAEFAKWGEVTKAAGIAPE